MKTHFRVLALLVLLGGTLLAACGGAAATEAPSPFDMEVAPAAAEAVATEAPLAQAVDAGSDVVNVNRSSEESAVFLANRMIIKNADIRLLVEDTDIAINGATQAIADAGGYIVSSRVWYQPWYDGVNYKYSTITIGVPVDQFERMLTRLRGLSVQVLDESATGEDVSDQYVDLQSQITNLEATRDRIKSFLEDAKTVDEALRINQELANVEAQIEEIKGRMNYLKDRSAYSTITINFEPVLPEIVSTPTPTPIPAPGWNPGETFDDAKKSVTSAYQGIMDFLIWFFVVLVPIFAPPILIGWALWKWFSRKPNKPSQ